jgi:hypothetical protein
MHAMHMQSYGNRYMMATGIINFKRKGQKACEHAEKYRWYKEVCGLQLYYRYF